LTENSPNVDSLIKNYTVNGERRANRSIVLGVERNGLI
jgi:hypothetical protein